MDRFHEMQVFLAVAEEEGFAAAARRLNTSPPSVTRAIAAMEARIGTQLLARTTRSLHLTEAGQRYLEDCRRILAELDEAEEAAAGSYTIPCGHLTVTAPVLFGELYVAPALGEYLDRFAQVSINALLVDRVVNMLDEGVDVAVRIGHLQEPGQQAIKVGEVRRVALLVRSTRGVSLTEAGQAYLADCVRLLAAVDAAQASAKGMHDQAQGNLRVFLPLLFSRYVMAPVLAGYMDRYPDVHLVAHYHDYYPNLHEEGLDVAILVG